MHPTPTAAITSILASGGSAYLFARRMRFATATTTGLIAVLILWQAIEIIPVQVAAALEMLGWVGRVSVSAVAESEVLLLAVVALWHWATKRSDSPNGGTHSDHRETLPPYLLVAGALLLGSYLAFAVGSFTGFPSGSDALTYHLPLAVRWLQDGSLAIPASRAWQESMPGNAEILMAILLSSGKQSLVIMASWIPALILVLSTYELGMWIQQGNRLAAISGCLIVLSVPMIEFQVFSAYVDLLGTAGVLAASALILSPQAKTLGEQRTRLTPSVAFVAALACGISIGTKPVYYFYALVFCLFAFAVSWANREQGPKALLRSAMLVVLGMLLPSMFWFARGWKQTGNPLFPMQVKIGQRVVFPGYEPSEITHRDFELDFVHNKREWPFYPWTEWKRSTGYLQVPYGEGEGFGAAFATFVPIGILFIFFQGCVLGGNRWRDWLLLGLFFTLVVSWWVLMERVLRFGQVIWVFACILTIPLIAGFESRKRTSFQLLLVASIAATSVICASVALHGMAGQLRKHLWSRSQIYHYPKLIDQLPPGSWVLNASGSEENNFPLAGAHLTNHVIANFEMPSELTPESLGKTGADYVVEVVPSGNHQETFLPGSRLILVDDELVATGEDRLRWRIWKVERENPSPIR